MQETEWPPGKHQKTKKPIKALSFALADVEIQDFL